MAKPHWYRPESERYLTLDALRFTAAYAIVLLHYGGQAAWTAPWTAVHAWFSHLQMAVDLFFVISGVMMADLYGGKLGDLPAYLGFLRRRIARLLPLHYATLGLIAAGAVFKAASHTRPFDLCGFVSNLFMLQAFGLCDHLSFNKPAWSISAEMGLYLVLPLFLAIANWRGIGWAIVAAAFAYALWADFTGAWTWLHGTYDFGVLRGAPAFLTGILLARTSGLARLPAPRLLLLATFGGLLIACALPAPNALRVAGLYLVVAPALAVDRQARAGAIARAVAPLGRLTYSIYMLHHLVAAVLVTAVAEKALGLTGTGRNLAILASGLVVLPAVATASFILFEGPMRRWISGRSPGAEALAPGGQPSSARPGVRRSGRW